MVSYGSHESSQCAELGCEGEVEFSFILNCVSPGRPAQLYGPPEGCFEAEAAEFELESVHVIDADGKPVEISEEILEAFVGKDDAQKMFRDAELSASESGGF